MTILNVCMNKIIRLINIVWWKNTDIPLIPPPISSSDILPVTGHLSLMPLSHNQIICQTAGHVYFLSAPGLVHTNSLSADTKYRCQKKKKRKNRKENSQIGNAMQYRILSFLFACFWSIFFSFVSIYKYFCLEVVSQWA